MFGLFKNNDIKCPLPDEKRVWIEKAILWLFNSFGEDNVKSKQILTPHVSDFAVVYDGSKQCAVDTLKIITKQMDIDFNEVELDIYIEGQTEIDTGNPFGGRIFMKQIEGEKYSGGLYWGKQGDGKYHIGIEEKKLTDPLGVVATLSHELAHVKLLGEKRIEKNNEPLTDLTTVVFGLGIFNANAAFQTKSGINSWGWTKLGYLSQMEWGYALALFSYLRKEESPEWIRFLTTNVKSDFKQSAQFINTHSDKIFNSP